ncbi:Lysosomal protective protein [Trichoplax sp. H2]|nr:Lysosomal protective protein [Trichoplax sp. H2]|eukprot:RDD46483.1 Lysosomal protective protein [Trichoplax sp. H2]
MFLSNFASYKRAHQSLHRYFSCTKWLLIVQIVIFFNQPSQATSYTSEALADEVHQLPGLKQSIRFRHFSGYFNVGSNDRLHYWFFESQGNASADPVVLWLNGGPGCSSLSGLINEHGPFSIEEDLTLSLRNTSWNKFANIIYLESPIGVGYSYNTQQDYTSSDNSTAMKNHQAIKEFYKRFPQYSLSNFYLSGESYGAVYVTTLALRLIQDSSLSLAGIMIGSGIFDFQKNFDSAMFFGYYHALYGPVLWDRIKKFCCYAEEKCIFYQSNEPICQFYFLKAYRRLFADGLNSYNVYQDCWSETPYNTRLQYSISALAPNKWDLEYTTPRCFNRSKEKIYFNLPQVRSALHIHSQASTWAICNSNVYRRYQFQYKSILNQLQTLRNYRILLYFGDTDLICNIVGGRWNVEHLNRTMIQELRPWHYTNENGKQVAGFVERFQNLDYLTVKGAGHLVSEGKPNEAMVMFKSFIQNVNYP